jgi:hypothetical protein
MELKHWLIVFVLLTTIIFAVMFVESAVFVRLGYRYANLLGYAEIFVFAALIVQGFGDHGLEFAFVRSRLQVNRKLVAPRHLRS